MNTTVVEVRAQDGGQTLAKIVREALSVPWSRARSLCERGAVRVDGEVTRDSARRMVVGARVEIDPAGCAPRAQPGAFPRERLLLVDRDVVVVDKPPGLQSVPFHDDDHDSVVQHVGRALAKLEDRRLPPLRVVQRLDKDTTGVMVFARTREAEVGLAQQFRRHNAQRRYLGLAWGEVRAARIESVLLPDRGDGLRGSWQGHDPARAPSNGRRAVTWVEPMELLQPGPEHFVDRQAGAMTLVSCRLETGRTHQIRIHLAEAGHPLVGESVYIRDYRGPRLCDRPEHPNRPVLHAELLGFTHPRSGQALEFHAPIPADLTDWLGFLGQKA